MPSSKTSRGIDDASYEVGYGKPPKHTRFQPGQSGNPKGRRKKVKPSMEMDDIFRRALDGPVNMTEGGKRVVVTKREALVAKVVSDAFNSKPSALKLIGDYLSRERLRPKDKSKELSEEYQILIGRLLDRVVDGEKLRALYDTAREKDPSLPDFKWSLEVSLDDLFKNLCSMVGE